MTPEDQASVRLRDATPADHPFLRSLNREAYEPLAVRLFGAWDEVAQDARVEAKIRSLPFRVIELDGRPVGAIASTEHTDHVFLHEMMLRPEAQGRGVGGVVLAREIRRAQALGKPLRLHTSVLNRAQRFYLRHGLVETGRDASFVHLEHPVSAAGRP